MLDIFAWGSFRMKLEKLLGGSGEIHWASEHKVLEIEGISTDPHLCRPGFLYVAAESETVDSTRYGVYLDGRDYISQAIANGAVAVLTDPECKVNEEHELKASFIFHQRPLAILGNLSARFFGERHPKHIALVTGTNGKTSTVNFAKKLWHETGRPACSVGNLGGVLSDGKLVWSPQGALSVPDTVTVHSLLKSLAESGIDHVAMEATSHGLHDYRLHGVPAKIGAFSNLTRDHLDFHSDMEEYFQYKMKLFKEVLAPGTTAVINADAEHFKRVKEICKQQRLSIISFGKNGSEIHLLDSRTVAAGQMIKLEVFGKTYETEFNLFGFFQLSNALCSLGIVIASGVAVQDAIDQLCKLTPIEGRLNLIGSTPSGGKVVTDWAHSPDGIKAALDACRSFTPGKIIVVFSLDGNRDKGKRPEMAEEASKLADEVIVTDGISNGEDLAEIRRQILSGSKHAREISPRQAAIDYALRALGPSDTALIAGTVGADIDKETALEVVRSLSQEKKL